MPARLEGKIAIIIGAARGIGEGIARRFVTEGASLVMGDTDVERGAASAKALGPTVRFQRTDISQPEDVKAVVGATVDAFGGLDIIVQNAGIYPWTLIENITLDEWDRVLGVNLKGCFLAARAALPAMRERGGGRMIFTSSITGPRVTSPGHGHYSASKAGINGFIRAAAIEFAQHRITVNGIEPGNIATEAVREHRSAEFIRSMEAMIPLGRLGTPEDVAGAALFLASDDAAYITGTTIIVDGGQILPEGADFRIKPG
jgi:3-oxoacyl-[acyl-carrier protein] reductase